MPNPDLSQLIAREMGLRAQQVAGAIQLLDDDNTVPFIARYRKEVTDGLDEEQLRQIEKRRTYLRSLADRKAAVMASIEEQGKLTDALRAEIEAAATLQAVEDLYLPYKPKRRTRATMAREKGLQPLADQLLQAVATSSVSAVNLDDLVAPFLNENVASLEDALKGAADIIAEQVAENASARAETRERTARSGRLVVSLADASLDPTKKYELYYNYAEDLALVPPHRWLAINRGEREGVLKVRVDAPTDQILPLLEGHVGLHRLQPSGSKAQRAVVHTIATQVREAVHDGYKRLIAPSIEREVRGDRTDVADSHAVQIFAANLRALLLQPPLPSRVILGIDPGIRTGCKLAVIDATGKVLVTTTVYPFEPRNERRETRETLTKLIQKLGVTIVAIGNGTASRETEMLVAEVVGEVNRQAKGLGVMYAIVSEAGASVYSASPLARHEMPDLDVTMRGAVSIARRLQDPLAELVKIDPRSIGVGLYQHDVDQRELGATLDAVVESCVNRVGVDLNTASPALLKYVSGLTSKQAEAIVAHRDEHGAFQTRDQLRKVKGVGPKAFQQAAGFLKIPDGKHP
ncbi:MAG: helix-hairpin-helix domain-containing protein, partial [Anaerolineae bacterium]|nr:helix-hairpin-helix domain-containing protein [Anaerolineae bacterium]